MFQQFFQKYNASRIKAIAFTGGLALCGLSQVTMAAEDCDRTCLADMITLYTEALLAHDPSMLPLADSVKFTVDGRAAQMGEGLWQSATALQGFRQDYLDIAKQVAASHVVVREGEVNQVLLSVLLHIEDRQVTGIETLLSRITPESRFQPQELGGPIRGMNDPVPAGERMSRREMIDIALTYPEGLRIGSFIDAGTPFAEGTYRVENGVITADDSDARRRMYDQNIIVHPGIITSVAAVDEENGIVLLWMNFGHTGDSYGVGNSLITYEAFKVWGGEIQSVNAFFTGLPISISRFWPSSDPVPR